MTASYPPPPSAPAARTPQPVRARAALIAALLVVAISLAGTVFSYLTPSILAALDLAYTSYPLLYLPFQIVGILLAITALILGLPPLVGPGPRGIAGMAVGIAGASLVSVLFSLALGPLLSIVL